MVPYEFILKRCTIFSDVIRHHDKHGTCMIMNVCTLYNMLSYHHYLNSTFQCNSDSSKNNAPIEVLICQQWYALLSMIHIHTIKNKTQTDDRTNRCKGTSGF